MDAKIEAAKKLLDVAHGKLLGANDEVRSTASAHTGARNAQCSVRTQFTGAVHNYLDSLCEDHDTREAVIAGCKLFLTKCNAWPTPVPA